MVVIHDMCMCADDGVDKDMGLDNKKENLKPQNLSTSVRIGYSFLPKLLPTQSVFHSFDYKRKIIS